MVTKWATLVVGCAGIRQTNTSRHIVALHWVGIGHCNQSDKKQNPNLHSGVPTSFRQEFSKKAKNLTKGGKNHENVFTIS